MEFGDFLWALLMFITGILVFRITSLKRFMEIAGGVISVWSLCAIATKPELVAVYVLQMPVSYIGGAITHYVYLIGANIGRADQFGNDINWGRIILYGVILAGLILLLRWLSPLLTI